MFEIDRRVLVLLATYNGQGHISQLLDSVFAQVGVSVNVLVSDDCSTDRTVEVIKSYAEERYSIEILSTGHKFGSAAANFFYLAQNANSLDYDYICFADQDDIWDQDKLDFSIRQLELNKCEGFSSSVEAYWPASGRSITIVKSQPQTSQDYWFESPGPGCTQVFTSQSFIEFSNFLIKNKNFLTEIDYHDWLVYAYYRFHGMRWYISPVSKIKYIQHEKNQIGANSGFLAVVRRFRMVSSRWYRKQVNSTFKLVSGSQSDLISMKYMVRNALVLRRKRSFSVIVFLFYIFGLF